MSASSTSAADNKVNHNLNLLLNDEVDKLDSTHVGHGVLGGGPCDYCDSI